MSFAWQTTAARGALLVAHRGASALAPENTLPAIESALAAGVDAVEIDVQRTADGVLVLVHDDTWLRTAATDADVRDLDWRAVSQLDAGGWFDPHYRGTAPARLDDVLDLIRGRAALDLEIKSPQRDSGLAAAVVDCVRAHAMQDDVLLTSFDHACIDALADGTSDFALGYIANRVLTEGHARVSVCAYDARLLLNVPSIAAGERARGRRVLAWTVDDAAMAAQLVRIGVDAIVTNDPAALVPVLSRERS